MWLKFWFFLCVIITVYCDELLCSDKKKHSVCLCSKYTDPDSTLPISEMNCMGMLFKTFPNASQIRSDIDFLDLSFNLIDVLDPKDYTVSHDRLRKLSLAHNHIRYIQDEFFEGLPNLHSLDLSHNNISYFDNSDVFFKLKRLKHLHLRYNNIQMLPESIFEPHIHLNILKLSYNPLGGFLTKRKDVLQKVLFVSNNLTHLELDNVGLNYIHNSYFDGFDQLKHVSLADNNFDTIPTFPGSIEYLDLSGNNITFVSAKYLNYHSLKVLRLSRMNSFVSVDHYAFYNLPSLEKLIITDCPNLKEFSDLAFGLASKTTTEHPHQLSLARNGLRRLNETYKFLFRKMDHVDLGHNPWHCDCDLLWVKEFKSVLHKSENIRCSSPFNLENRKVLELRESDLLHCHPHIYGKQSHRILIVILMAAVILLMGLVFYLIKYPIIRGVGFRGLGPNSPYNQAPVIIDNE